ncbi:MAG TPA: hypothetical protein VH092_03210 [Urbifossiella sp.]|nr:hypothetical protein [Urbifossiella sp.]
MQGVIDFLTFLVAIWLIVVLWGIKEIIPPGEHQAWILTLVNVTGTGVAMTLVSLTVMSWKQEWRGKTDHRRYLSGQASKLAARFHEIFQEEEFSEPR